MTPIAQVREALLSRLRASVRGVPVLRLLDLVDGDELRLAAVIWRLTVAGDLHLTYATEGMPETAYAGPCHAVPQRFAAACLCCKDRLAQLSSAERRTS